MLHYLSIYRLAKLPGDRMRYLFRLALVLIERVGIWLRDFQIDVFQGRTYELIPRHLRGLQ